VRAVLTGRVAQRGEQLFVSVELTDAADNTHVWGEQYDRRLADVFSVQQEIARDVSRRLRLKLSGEETGRAARRDADNFEAYQLYLRGRHEWHKFTPDSLARSIDYFNRAVAADPAYALAYAGLSNAYNLKSNLVGRPTESQPRAKWAAEKAVELDPSLPEAQSALGAVRLFTDWDWPGAEDSLRRALRLNPNSAEAHTLYAAYLCAMGRTEEAKDEVRRALELDPLSLFEAAETAQVFYFAREYDEAIAQARRGFELGPHLLLYHALGRALVQKDRQREAIEELKKGLELMRGNPTLLATLGHAYATAGRREEALKVLAEMEATAGQRYVPPYWLAVVAAGLDDRERAFELLSKAADERFFMLIWLDVEPRFDRLRSDARYPALARRVGLPER
jgi:tetratricopeptide (TPR) repeat protein